MPRDEDQFRQLLGRLRRLGHQWEQRPGTAAHLLGGNHRHPQGRHFLQYFADAEQPQNDQAPPAYMIGAWAPDGAAPPQPVVAFNQPRAADLGY